MSTQTAITLSEKGILHVSDRLGEDARFREKRLEAYRTFVELEVPRWDRTSLSGLELDEAAIGSEEVADVSTLPPALEAFVADRGAEGTYVIEVDQQTHTLHVHDDLKAQGVIVTDYVGAVTEHADLFAPHYGTVIPANEDKLIALHYAAVSSGLFVYVPKNVAVKHPIEYRFHGTENAFGLFPHVLIVAEQGAEVTVIEGASSDDGDRQRVVSEIVEVVPGDGAIVRFGSVQTYGRSTWQSTVRRASVGRDGRMEWMAGDFGSRLSRSHNKSILVGEGAESTHHAVFFGDGNQHLDVGITQMHVGAHTASDMLTKGVLDDRSRVVYRGLTDIENGARYASGFQNENTMLLSKRARSDAIPGLEIDESEVQAGHAATTGQIDPLHLFYLKSRGISEDEAVRLIVAGFFDPVISGMSDERLREEITALVDGKMRR